MQEIMAKYNIPANVPYDQIASTGSGVRVYQSRLSADDQREFDKYYTKWVNDTRKNDRDDVAKDVGRMQEIMARNNIPASVPFEQIASTGYPGNGYPPTAYPANGQWQGRLSPYDQRDFVRGASLLDFSKAFANREPIRLLHLGIQSCDLIERDAQTHFGQITVLDVNRHAEHADTASFELRQKMRDESARLITLFIQIDQQIEVKIDNPTRVQPVDALCDGFFWIHDLFRTTGYSAWFRATEVI